MSQLGVNRDSAVVATVTIGTSLNTSKYRNKPEAQFGSPDTVTTVTGQQSPTLSSKLKNKQVTGEKDAPPCNVSSHLLTYQGTDISPLMTETTIKQLRQKKGWSTVANGRFVTQEPPNRSFPSNHNNPRRPLYRQTNASSARLNRIRNYCNEPLKF